MPKPFRGPPLTRGPTRYFPRRYATDIAPTGPTIFLSPAGIASDESMGGVSAAFSGSIAGIVSAESLSISSSITVTVKLAGIASAASDSPSKIGFQSSLHGIPPTESLSKTSFSSSATVPGISSAESLAKSGASLVSALPGIVSADSQEAPTRTGPQSLLHGIPSYGGQPSPSSTITARLPGIASSEVVGTETAFRSISVPGIVSGESLSSPGRVNVIGSATGGIASNESIGSSQMSAPGPPPPPPIVPKRGVVPPPQGPGGGGTIQDRKLDWAPPFPDIEKPLVVVEPEPLPPPVDPPPPISNRVDHEADYVVMPTVKESAVRAMASGSVERFTDPKVGLSLVLTSLEGVRYLYGGLFRYEGVASQVKTGDVIGYAARAIPPVVETVPLQLAAPPKV